MLAIFEKTEVRIQVRVAGLPRDRASEINTPAFLKALLDGSPAAERAFRDLALHLEAPLSRYVGKWLRDGDAVEDVLQETFLAVHRSLPRFEGKSCLTTWVYSLAHHKVMDRLSQKYRPGQGCDSAGECFWEVEDAGPRPDEAAHQTLLIARIRSVAEALPEMYRDAWRLRDLEGRSGEEAAEALGITESLLRVRLHRARSLIASSLRKDHPGLFEEREAAARTGLRLCGNPQR